MAEPRTALGYWVESAGRGALRETRLPDLGSDGVALQTRFSGISPGTERLVGLGQVPASCAAAMACQGMQGSFDLPVLYGYCLVAEALTGPLAGRRVFTMHPHVQRAVVAPGQLVPLPDDVPSPRATLLPNLETALNAAWDAELRGDEAVAVLGAGAVGLLVAFVLSRTHRGEIALVERDPERRARAQRLPWVGTVLLPAELPRGRSAVAFHATASSDGLQLGLDALSFEGRLVELSWYGARPVQVDLGSNFHHRRLRIVASQVGTIAPSHRAAGHAARTAAVLRLLADPQLDALLGEAIPFEDLPQFFDRLYRGESTPTCPHVRYTNPR